MSCSRSVLIVGGGIIGVTSAYALAEQGWRVRVVDSLAAPGLDASFGNGRQLSYSYTNALASPETLAHFPKVMLGCDPSLRLKLSPEPSFLSWLLRFAGNCSEARFRANTLASLELAHRSAQAMANLTACHPLDFEYRSSGKMVIYRSAKGFARAQEIMALKNSHGANVRACQPAEAIDLEPSLSAVSGDLAGAIHSAGDDVGNCRLFAVELLKLAQTRFGVEFTPDCSVVRLRLAKDHAVAVLDDGDEIRAARIVVASGSRANDLLAPIGFRQPLASMKGYSFTAPFGDQSPSVSITDPERRIVFTNTGNRMLVAGLAELGESNSRCDPGRIEVLKSLAEDALPKAADYSSAGDSWAGLRPVTPNSLPITRMLAPSLAVNIGHGMLGWTLALGSGQVLAEQFGHAG